MHERLKKLRKALELTQQEFADKIGIKRNSFANYETGRNTPLDAIVVSICREFNVNEEWLRNGTGNMFLPKNREDEISEIVRNLLSDENNTFKSRFIIMLANLSVSDWERLEKETRKLLSDNNQISHESVEMAAAKEHTISIEEAEKEYIKSRSRTAPKTDLSALNITRNTTNTKVAN